MPGTRIPLSFIIGPTFALASMACAPDAWAAPTVLKDCDQCPEVVVIPAGQFTMGAIPGEQGAEEDEGPPHTVSISKPFALGKYEVTHDEWETCVVEKACERVPDEGWGRGKRPVLHVDYEQAVGYAKWLSAKTGKVYRLPSEAEWEYAARAGTDQPRPWGADAARACHFSNIYDESAKMKYRFGWRSFPCDDKHVETAPVGSFAPNAFGLHDMLGNVWEWVADCYAPYASASADGSAVVDEGCKKRISRGGSWNVFPVWVRVSYRYGLEPGLRSSNLGLRVLRQLP
jgi:formylglycine-generating enzyme required for sulfatase activity